MDFTRSELLRDAIEDAYQVRHAVRERELLATDIEYQNADTIAVCATLLLVLKRIEAMEVAIAEQLENVARSE